MQNMQILQNMQIWVHLKKKQTIQPAEAGTLTSHQPTYLLNNRTVMKYLSISSS